MPLVQIDLDRALTGQKLKISEQVHQAFVDALGVPATDRWCIIHEHDPAELIFDPTNGGVDRRSMLCIQVTFVRQYDAAARHRLFTTIAGRLEDLGIRHEDLLICATENQLADWYDGQVHGG